ncbi:MAG TPA: hypothetical protein VMU77_05595 [Acidimicrobiales bacterium]|nr:hypothetical protein [Acidimicrobiales bacterium]
MSTCATAHVLPLVDDGLVLVTTSPELSTATQSEVDGQATAFNIGTGPPTGPGSSVTLTQSAGDPPVGSEEKTICPTVSTATHKVVEGQAIDVISGVCVSEAVSQLPDVVGVVDDNTSPPASTAIQTPLVGQDNPVMSKFIASVATWVQTLGLVVGLVVRIRPALSAPKHRVVEGHDMESQLFELSTPGYDLQAAVVPIETDDDALDEIAMLPLESPATQKVADGHDMETTVSMLSTGLVAGAGQVAPLKANA